MDVLKTLVITMGLAGLVGCGDPGSDDPEDPAPSALVAQISASDAVREYVAYEPTGAAAGFSEWESYERNAPIQIPVINRNSGGVAFDDETIVEFLPESGLPLDARIVKAELVVPAIWRGDEDAAFCAMLHAWLPSSGSPGLTAFTAGAPGTRFVDLCRSARDFGELFRIDVTDHVKAQWQAGAPVDFRFAALAAAPKGGLYLNLQPRGTQEHVRLEVQYE